MTAPWKMRTKEMKLPMKKSETPLLLSKMTNFADFSPASNAFMKICALSLQFVVRKWLSLYFLTNFVNSGLSTKVLLSKHSSSICGKRSRMSVEMDLIRLPSMNKLFNSSLDLNGIAGNDSIWFWLRFSFSRLRSWEKVCG